MTRKSAGPIMSEQHPLDPALERELRAGDWHKLLVYVMYKLGVTDLTLLPADIDRVKRDFGGANIVAKPTDVGIGLRLRILSDIEAAELRDDRAKG